MMHARWLLILLCLFGLPAAASNTGGDIPPALQPWQDWVLHDVQGWHCPHPPERAEPVSCQWPGVLELELDARGGRFSQRWQVYESGPVPLPGGEGLWPQQVRVDGKPVPVVPASGHPAVHLPAGTHRIEGRFQWHALPGRLPLSPAIGLLRLRIDGHEVPAYRRDANGLLWLGPTRSRAARPEADRVFLQVFRRIDDRIPVRIETRIHLRVSGQPREARLPLVLPEGFTPYRLHSSLPARLEADGQLRLQLRPGIWQITLLARSTGPVRTLALPAATAPWPQEELWSLDSGHYREAELGGGERVDPTQTELPPAWQKLPTRRMIPGKTRLELVELRRLSPEDRPDQLELRRSLWPDIHGSGWTVVDQMEGRLQRSWRLQQMPPLLLGRASANGRDRLITRLPEEPAAGIELREGKLALMAVSRIEEDTAALPANGWNTRMDRVSATLNLPPGWRLLATRGTEPVSGAWLQRWTLLDLFLVLITAVACLRLFGPAWGLVALLALGLAWHEPGAPHYAWLHLLAAAGLARVLPAGRLQWLARIWQWLALGILLLVLLPFSVQELRSAIYPQLDYPGIGFDTTRSQAPPHVARAKSAEARMAGMPVTQADTAIVSGPAARHGHELDQLPANALVQSGPAIPEWHARRHALRWSGPVAPEQTFRLWLLGPRSVSLLKLLAVLAAFLLAARLAGLPLPRPRRAAADAALLLPGLLSLTLCTLPGPVRAETGFPPPELLKQLRERLLEPDACLPHCASLAAARVALARDRLTLELELHAQADTAFPLPAVGGGWQTMDARLDKRPALLRREQGRLVLLLPKGLHHLRLSGRLPPQTQHIDISFPLPAQTARIEIVPGSDWHATPLPTGTAIHRLALERTPPAAAENGSKHRTGDRLQPGPLPELLRVERTLTLGQQSWSVLTRIQREGMNLAPVHIELPLLEGEAPLSATPEVREGRARILLPAGQRSFSFRSRLEIAPRIALVARPDSLPAGKDGWYEVWQVKASPVWHLRHEGLPLTAMADASGHWQLTWQPWPGDSVHIEVLRPAAVPGPTLTLQSLRALARPGAEHTRHELTVQLYATQGETWRPGLPRGAQLQQLVIDGRERPLGQQTLPEIPVTPGRHTIKLAWTEPTGAGWLMRTTAFDAALPTANLHLQLDPGRNRWILFTGGLPIGPAVLYWGTLAVILLLAWALGRSRLTPLGSVQWALLGMGLSQSPAWLGLLVAGWLLALGLRQRHWPARAWLHNLLQILLVLLTVIALLLLFAAVREGLLGRPEMQVSGPAALHQAMLEWYADRAGPELPRGWILSLPLWVYRVLMLGWALWLAFALLGWLRWGWEALQQGGLWRALPPRRRHATAAGNRAGEAHNPPQPPPGREG